MSASVHTLRHQRTLVQPRPPVGAICQLHHRDNVADVRRALIDAGVTGLRVQIHGRRRWLVATQEPQRPLVPAHVPDWRRWLAALAGALGLALLLSAALTAVASIGGVAS